MPLSDHRSPEMVGFGSEDDDDEDEEEAAAPIKDELKEYLALQIKYKSEQDVKQDAMLWWLEHRQQFPNLEVMARQYLGCPATSASVERLFSVVGIFFSDKRKSSTAKTLENLVFTKMNVE